MRSWITDSSVEGGLRLADDLPEPQPRADEVIVEVKAYSLNRGELSLLSARPDGFRPGQDVSGIVHRSIEGGPSVGSRVVALVDWHGWAERVAVPKQHLALLPDNVSFTDAATLPVAGLTALRALRTGGGLLGKKVLITGATGGVGQVAVQLAVAAGAQVTAYVRDEQKRKEAQELGAHQVISSLENATSVSYHLILDGVGGPTLIEALHYLAPGGTLAMYGVLGGKAPLDIFDFASCPNARLVGLFLHEPGDTCGEELTTLVHLVADGRLHPHIDLCLSWEQTPKALAALRQGSVRGKAVLTLY